MEKLRPMKLILRDLISNPDGTGSTKRSAGWVLILVSLIFGIVSTYVSGVDVSIFSMVFITSMSAGLSAFGLSSYDTKAYYAHVKDTLKSSEGTVKDIKDTLSGKPETNGQSDQIIHS